MPYIDLAGLSRFDAAQKDALARDYALLRDMQWTRSEKAGAVSLWPVGGTQLKPSVDFLFSETPPAEGDKGPENPSTITGVSEINVWRTGLNVADPMKMSIMNMSRELDGWFSGTLNNTSSSSVYMFTYYGKTVPVREGESYCAVVETENSDQASFATTSNNAGQNPQLYASPSLTLSGTTKGKTDLIVKTSGGTPDILLRVTNPVAAGTSKTLKYRCAVLRCPASDVDLNSYVYEPYAGEKYTLPLGNTYYGGTLDVASGVMTVTWEKLTATGGEAWQDFGEQATGVYSYALVRGFNADGGATGNGDVCSHFIYNNGANEKIVSWHHSKKYIYVYSSISSLSDFKAWLAAQLTAGTPVEFCFQSNTPTTAFVTPTEIFSLTQPDKYMPRLNTVYTDASAVQVGYVKSPIRDEYELQQAVIAQGGNV